MPLPNLNPDKTEGLYKATRTLLEAFDIDYNKENADHLLVMLEVLALYNERTKRYGLLWQKCGAAENFFDAFRKARRINTRLGMVPVALRAAGSSPDWGNLDDAFDTINYVLFGIRNARDGRLDREEDDA